MVWVLPCCQHRLPSSIARELFGRLYQYVKPMLHSKRYGKYMQNNLRRAYELKEISIAACNIQYITMLAIPVRLEFDSGTRQLQYVRKTMYIELKRLCNYTSLASCAARKVPNIGVWQEHQGGQSADRTGLPQWKTTTILPSAHKCVWSSIA